MPTEVSSLAPRAGESQVEHYRRAFPLTTGTTEERNAAVLDAWDQSTESAELDTVAAKKFPAEKFSRVSRVPVFTEHQTDRDNWDHGKLASLVETMNHRILDTGSFSPLTEGHTPDGAAIQQGAKQPRILGYQGKLRLGLIGNKDPKWAVFADEYHHVAEADNLSRLTRRSPEVWTRADKPFYDPCAALGAETPRLDMGTISYSRQGYWTGIGSDGAQVEKYSMTAPAAFPGVGNVNVPTDKYTADSPVDQDSDDQAGAVVDAVVTALSAMPEFQAIQQLLPLLPKLQELALKQELPPDEPACDAAPAPAPVADADADAAPQAEQAAAPEPAAPPPAGDVANKPHHEGKPAAETQQAEAAPVALGDDDAEMMTKYMAGSISEADLKNYRDGKKAEAAKPETAEHYQLKAEISDLQRKKQQLEAEIQAQAVTNREAVRYSRLDALRDQGYEFELADELRLTSSFSDEQFATHCDRVVTKYSRLPVGQRSFPVMEGDGLPQSTPEQLAEQKAIDELAIKYALIEAGKGRKIDMRQAREAVRAQAISTSTSVK